MVNQVSTRLDEFMPEWQFNERHSIDIDAAPTRAYDAMKAVTAGEILFFNALTWIRRGGRRAPESILNAAKNEPLIDVATRTGFVRLADDAPRELVVGTIIHSPNGDCPVVTPEFFKQVLPPGHTLAAMNFLVTPNGRGGSIVSTETRVFANSRSARRAFAAYWAVIYPGSAFIRRMWLRAIRKRALSRR